MDNNLEQLKKLGKIFNSDKLVTSDDIAQVLQGIMSLLSNFKKDTVELNTETKTLINGLLTKIEDKYDELSKDIDSNTKTRKEAILSELEGIKKAFKEEFTSEKKSLETKVKKVNKLLDEIKTFKPKDGKNADEKKIVKEVLSKIPKYKETILDTPEQLADKLEMLKGDKRLDASAIKNLPQFVESKANGGGWRNLFQLHDVSLNDPTNDQVLKYNSTTGVWENGTVTSGASTLDDVSAGSITTADSLYQMKSGVDVDFKTSGGTSLLTLDETNARVLVGNVRALTSAGILFEGNSGTDVALFGAGGGAGATFYGGVNIAGNLAVDTDVLYVNTTTNRVGINTASPTTTLDNRGDFYTGNGTNGFTFSSNGITPQINGFILVDNSNNREFAITNSAASLNYLKVDNTLTGGRLLSGIASAASKSAMLFNGTWFKGGTTTTTFPHLLLEATGTTASTTWSASGTGLGINAVNGFGGNFIDMKTNGATVYRFSSNGQIVFGTSGSALETGSEIDVRAAGGGGGLRGVRLFTNSALSSTSGNVYTVQTLGTFGAGAGSANYRAHTIEYTINNSGAQSGVATGLYINATETALNSMTSYLIDANVAGSSKFSVTNTGAVTSGTIISNSTIEAGAGNSLRWTSRSRMNSPSDGVITFLNSSSNDFGRLQFGGTTSSFPALKRSSAVLQARLADDSAYAQFDALGYSVGGVAGFTGTGAYTNFTIVGGIITNAT